MLYLMWAVYGMVWTVGLAAFTFAARFWGLQNLARTLGWRMLWGPLIMVPHVLVPLWASTVSRPGWALLFLPAYTGVLLVLRHVTFDWDQEIETIDRLAQELEERTRPRHMG